MRKALFAATPLCAICATLGRVRVAVVRDHVIALKEGGSDSQANTQALCAVCHREKTAREAARGARRTRGGVF